MYSLIVPTEVDGTLIVIGFNEESLSQLEMEQLGVVRFVDTDDTLLFNVVLALPGATNGDRSIDIQLEDPKIAVLLSDEILDKLTEDQTNITLMTPHGLLMLLYRAEQGELEDFIRSSIVPGASDVLIAQRGADEQLKQVRRGF